MILNKKIKKLHNLIFHGIKKIKRYFTYQYTNVFLLDSTLIYWHTGACVA